MPRALIKKFSFSRNSEGYLLYVLDWSSINSLFFNVLIKNLPFSEIITSVDYDKVDITEYLDNVIATNFDDLQVEWEVECKVSEI